MPSTAEKSDSSGSPLARPSRPSPLESFPGEMPRSAKAEEPREMRNRECGTDALGGSSGPSLPMHSIRLLDFAKPAIVEGVPDLDLDRSRLLAVPLSSMASIYPAKSCRCRGGQRAINTVRRRVLRRVCVVAQ